MNTNDRALTLAKAYARHPSLSLNCLHIYDDGYVVVVDGTADRHLACRESLQSAFAGFEEARSPGNDFSVFLVPDNNVPLPEKLEDDINPFLHVMTMQGGYHDHRQQDCHKTGLAVALARKTLEPVVSAPW
jgi:hypothetical protein